MFYNIFDIDLQKITLRASIIILFVHSACKNTKFQIRKRQD